MVDPPTRLAIFVPTLSGGGAERVMCKLAGGIAARGHAVDLVLARAEGPYLAEVPESVRLVDLEASRVLASLPALVRYLRRERPETKIVLSEPANAQLLGSGHAQTRNSDHSPAVSHPAFEQHPIQGWTPDFIPHVLQEAVDEKFYDDLIPVAGPEGIAWAQKLAQREGIMTGISGGSTFAVAMQIAEAAAPGTVILCMLPDTGERYISTPLFDAIPEDMTEEVVALSRSTPGYQLAAQ